MMRAILRRPILSGFIAYGIADRPGLVPGIVGGFIANTMGAGFLGGIVTGFIAGFAAQDKLVQGLSLGAVK